MSSMYSLCLGPVKADAVQDVLLDNMQSRRTFCVAKSWILHRLGRKQDFCYKLKAILHYECMHFVLIQLMITTLTFLRSKGYF